MKWYTSDEGMEKYTQGLCRGRAHNKRGVRGFTCARSMFEALRSCCLFTERQDLQHQVHPSESSGGFKGVHWRASPPSPPYGSKFFKFHRFFHKILLKYWLGAPPPPLGIGAPFQEKFWIRPQRGLSCENQSMWWNVYIEHVLYS